MKLCKRCDETKPETEFYPHKRTRDRLQYWCKTCQKAAIISGYRNDPQRHAAYNRDWGRKNPQRKADIALKTRLGLPHGTYARMLAEQEGICAICGTAEPTANDPRISRFAVDHDAETGNVRGLLCNSCNNGIGRFQHDTHRLRQAIEYLLRYTIYPKVPEFDTELSILHPNC